MIPIVILAGGLATRLRPLTEKIPKSMLIIDDKPFVYYQLKLFEISGVKQVHFCLGFLGEIVEEYIKENFAESFILSFSYDKDPLLGTGGAIVNAFSFLPETFFITYGDSYLDINYKDVYITYMDKRDENIGLMTVFRNSGKWDESNVIFTNDMIELYSKKNKTSLMNYIDFGLGILSKCHFSKKIAGNNFDLSEIYETLSIKKKLYGFEVFNRFYEVGSFSGIDDFSNHLKIK